MRIRNLRMSFDVDEDFTKDELEHETWSREEFARQKIKDQCNREFAEVPNRFTVGIVDMREYGDDVSVSAVVKA